MEVKKTEIEAIEEVNEDEKAGNEEVVAPSPAKPVGASLKMKKAASPPKKGGAMPNKVMKALT